MKCDKRKTGEDCVTRPCNRPHAPPPQAGRASAWETRSRRCRCAARRGPVAINRQARKSRRTLAFGVDEQDAALGILRRFDAHLTGGCPLLTAREKWVPAEH